MTVFEKLKYKVELWEKYYEGYAKYCIHYLELKDAELSAALNEYLNEKTTYFITEYKNDLLVDNQLDGNMLVNMRRWLSSLSADDYKCTKFMDELYKKLKNFEQIIAENKEEEQGK